MKYFRADLHVHSRFSRATSGRLNIRNLAAWSMIKGLSVMSTGDFTHPAWRDELRRDLVYDDNSGLYRVREKTPLETEIPGFSRPDGVSEPQFLIQAEISSIYKKDGSVRKVHNVVIMPSLESADKLSNKLAAIGNITSDGRPILGLDCEHLLEMVLEADERGVLIPAHIWTPWFSLFGSKSGFDALEDCFGSLSSHIFALETSGPRSTVMRSFPTPTRIPGKTSAAKPISLKARLPMTAYSTRCAGPPGTRKAQAASTGGRSSSSLRKENTTLTGTAPAMLSLSRKNP